MSSQPGSFHWKQLDEKLANARLSEIALEFGAINNRDFHQIHYFNMGNENAITVPSQRFEMHLRRSDEMAARVYDMYCEVWLCQQRSMSPAFVRGICEHGIRTLISARKSAISDEFAREQARTRKPNSQWLKSAVDAFNRNMELLFAKWQRQAEFDAKSLAYMFEGISNSPALDVPAAEVIRERAQVRIAETKLASIEKMITATERALSAAESRPSDPYRIKTLEQTLARFNKDKQQCEGLRNTRQSKHGGGPESLR